MAPVKPPPAGAVKLADPFIPPCHPVDRPQPVERHQPADQLLPVDQPQSVDRPMANDLASNDPPVLQQQVPSPSGMEAARQFTESHMDTILSQY